MGIKKITINGKRNGYAIDQKTGKHFSYEIDFYENGRRVREKGFRTRAQAEQAIAAARLREKEFQHGIPKARQPVTLKELIEKRVAAIESPNEKRRADRILNFWLDLQPDENIFVAEITSDHLRRYIEARTGKVSNATIDRDLTTIAAALHAAADLFPALEKWKCPRIPRPKVSKRRRERTITDAEKQKLLEWLNFPGHHPRRTRGTEDDRQRAGRLRGGQIFEFALLTGLRHGEICRLRVADYDEGRKVLKAVRQKTDSVSYLSPLTDRMIEILNARRDAPETNVFLFSDAGKNPNTFYDIMTRAAENCGIVYGRNVADGLILHDARHTFTTRLLQGGVDLATIQSFTGHSDREMVLFYSHAGTESRQRAMNVIEGKPENGAPETAVVVKFLRETFQAVKNDELSESEFIELLRSKIVSVL